MPNLSVDIPHGGGKTTLVPNFEIQRTAQRRSYKGWDGVEADYINPATSQKMLPFDWEEYHDEWMRLKNAKLGK